MLIVGLYLRLFFYIVNFVPFVHFFCTSFQTICFLLFCLIVIVVVIPVIYSVVIMEHFTKHFVDQLYTTILHFIYKT